MNERFHGLLPESASEVHSIDLLQRVLDETLRLYPPVPFDARRSLQEDTLPNGLKVPAGIAVVYSAYLMGRSERHWKEASMFKPDRWCNPEDISSLAFVPFHAGPQTCLGRNMAYLEAKALLLTVLPRLRFSLVPNQEIFPKIAIVLPAAHGIRVTVQRRTSTKSV